MENGIYEEVISNQLKKELDQLSDQSKDVAKIDQAEAPTVLADYISKIVKHRLESLNEDQDSLDKQVELTNNILSLVAEQGNQVNAEAEQLLAINANQEELILGNKSASNMVRPETSVATSSLFTGASREPRMYSELIKEIQSANQIDFLVSFIRWSGLRLILKELQEFTARGGKLRVITTTYMAATQAKAIVELHKLDNTEIKISYDTEHTRMHTKAYMFYRNTGYSTAYVGSSNMTQPAMTSGMEWNMKITMQDMPEVFEKIKASFLGYWNSGEFELYTDESYPVLQTALNKEKWVSNQQTKNYYFDIQPYPFQKSILEKLEAERNLLGIHRNLVVAATGTGKTIIAAFDYKAQCANSKKNISMLFVAHRKEILEQSLECFREVLNQPNFGGLLVGNYQPDDMDHLFISIGMLQSRKLWNIVDRDRYEYIVLDECHHMAASSYQPIMEYFRPKNFLGLTATPERMDGEDILDYFDHRISAEIRLPEAINRKLLCPFQYYGIADSINLNDVKWAKGKYDIAELENLYVFSTEISKKRASLIIHSLKRYVAELDDVKALAFCVSVQHAKFMSQMFCEAGIKATYLVGESSEEDRQKVKRQLMTGELNIVCVVDIYNEGVDIKAINTVLFLRPTESLTIFLQQLGRGLRHSEGKECLTVLDFVGLANRRYNFESKFAALLDGNNRGVKKEIENGFVDLPRGCYIKLEKKVQEAILANIKYSIGNKTGLLDKIKYFQNDTGRKCTLYNFLTYYKVSPRVIYRNKFTFMQAVKMVEGKNSDLYKDSKAWRQINHLAEIDSKEWIDYMLEHLQNSLLYEQCTEKEKQYWKMLYVSLVDRNINPEDNNYYKKTMDYFQKNQELMPELMDLLRYQLENIDFISKNNDLGFTNAMETYCTYTRAQALASFDYWKISSEGVTRIANKHTTCLFITLNKSNNYYSPSTSYHDYSINDELFHWQSQNATAPETSVGQRYIHHRELGEHILLFVRENKEDRYGSVAFTFLGEAEYVSHEGSKPMSIIWHLKNRIPAKYLRITDKLGIGC